MARKFFVGGNFKMSVWTPHPCNDPAMTGATIPRKHAAQPRIDN